MAKWLASPTIMEREGFTPEAGHSPRLGQDKTEPQMMTLAIVWCNYKNQCNVVFLETKALRNKNLLFYIA